MYLMTFHSQFYSNMFARKAKVYGKVRQKPVPRQLSSSCGTCCTLEPDYSKYGEEEILEILKGMDFEKLYRTGDEYELIAEKE